MRNLFKYLVVHPLLVLLLITVLLISGFALLSLTQTGTGLLVQLAQRALPSLELEGVSGTLVSQVEAESLVWEKDGIRVDAQQAVFEPEIELKIPLKLTAKQLTARRLVIDLPPSEDKPYEPVTIPDLRLPVEANLNNVSLDELVINQGETEIVIRDVVLGAYTDSDVLHLTRLDGSLAGDLETVDMQATGEMGLSEPHPLQLNVSINSDSNVLGNGQLALVATGELQAYQAELKGNWKYADYPDYRVDVLGNGNFEGMMLDKLSLNGRAGNADLKGKLAWSPYLEWDLQGSAENVKPEFFAADITGEVDVALSSSGNFENEPVAKLNVSKLDGQLREFPLNATLDAELQGSDLLLHDLNARVGDNRLIASGQADEQLNIDWTLDAAQLSQFHPDLKGALYGKGMLSGKVDGSAFRLAIDQLSGEVMDYPVDAEGSLALQDQVVSAQGLKVHVGDNHLEMDGVADEAQGVDWSLDAAALEQLYPQLSGQLKGKGNARGLLDGSRLALRIDELEGQVKDYPVKAAGSVRIEGEQLSTENLKINVGENQISLNGQADEDSGIDWEIDAPELAVLYVELPGNLQGKGNAKGLLDGSRLALRIDELEGRVKDYPVKAAGSVRIEGEQLSTENLKINVGQNQISLNGQADEDSGIDWEIDAPELAVLYPELSGNLQGKGNAKGLLDGSRLALQIDELAGEVKDYPVKAEGAVRIEGEQLSVEGLLINVGENQVSLNGQANEDSGIDWRVDAPELAAFHPQLKGQLKGNGNAKGLLDGSRLLLEIAELEGQVQDYPLKAAGAIRVEGEQLSAENLNINVGENRLSLNGQADELSGINWELNAPVLATLYPQLSGNLQGKGNAKGLLDGSRLALQIDELAGEVQDYPVKAVGGVRIEGKRLFADDLQVNVGENQVSLNGQAAGGEGIEWRIDAPQLKALHPQLSGELKGNGNAKGRLDGSRFEVSVAELKGQVLDYPLQVVGAVVLEDGQLAADNLRISTGENQLSLNGGTDDEDGIGWQLDAPELADFHPQLSGELAGNGHISAKLDGSRLAVEIDELEGQLQEFPVKATGRVRLQESQLFADDLELSVGDNQLSLNGQADEGKGIDWYLDAPQLSALHPTLKGNLNGKGNVRGRLDGSRLLLSVDELQGEVQNYLLRANGDLSFENQLLGVDDLNVYVDENRITLDGVVDEDKGLSWVLDAPELEALNPALAGSVAGKGTLKGRLDGSRLAVSIDQLGGDFQGYPMKAVGSVLMEDGQLAVQGLKVNVGKNLISLDGPLEKGVAWSIDAPELAAFNPQLNGQLQGRGSVKGKMDGSQLDVGIEQLSGRVNGYPVQALGDLRLEDQSLTVRDLRVNVGQNSLRLNGAADAAGGISWSFDAPALTELSPGLQGQLKGNGSLEGRLDGSRLSVDIAELGGRINGFPVNVRGGLSREGDGFAADDLRVSMGQNSLRLDGVLDEKSGVNWSLDAPRLAEIEPSLQGSLQGNGNLRGVLDGSRLTVRVDKLNGRVMGYPLNAAGELSLKDQQLAAKNLAVNVGENALFLNGVMDDSSGLGWSLNAPRLVQISPALDGQLQGRGNIKGGMDAALITLNIAELNGRVKGFPVNALGTVQLRDLKQLQLSNLRVNVGANALRLNGPLDEANGIDWQLDANQLAQLNPALDGQLRGNGNIKGLLDGSRLTVRVNTLQGRVKQYPVQLSGEVSMNGSDLTARNVLLNSGQNTLKLNGGIGGSVGLNWQLDARNIGQLVPGMQASARGNGTISGQLDGPNLQVQIASLNGQIEGRPLAAKGTVSLQGERINLANLQVSAGGNNLVSLNGQVSEPLNLSWKINARNLAQAWPGLAGGLQGEGTVQGSMARPQVKGFLKGSNVRYQDLSVQALDITISQNGADYNVQGVLRNIKQGENVLTYAELKGQGTVERHSATLAAVHKDGKLNASISGGLVNGQWNGAVNTLVLRDTVAGDWQLTAPIRIAASDKAVTVTNSCLANRQNARLCAQQTSWTPTAGLVAKGQLQQVPLAMARTFLPNNIQLPGRLNADYQFEQRGGRPFARVNVQLPDNVIVVVSARGRKDTFRYTNARANLVLNDRNATVDAQLDVVGHGQMRTQGTVIFAPDNNQHRVDLRTTVNIPSITWLQRFSPQVDALQGSVNGDVRVAGLLSQPQVAGSLRLQGGSLYLPETGSRLTDVNLNIQASRADQLAINGTLRAGSGQLTANGVLRLAQLPNWSADVRLQGNDLLLMNSHEIQARVSPDLNVKAGPDSVVITGTLLVPETTVTLRELPTSASVRSDDIVIVGKGRPQPNEVRIAPDSGKPLYIQPNVTIVLGDRVSFSGFGLDARMTGRMRVLRNRQDIVAEGVLNVVDGVYKAYGQNLRIERGRLLFNGPIDNPGLDVRATRKVENDSITVGMSLSGSVQAPESTLFSNPPQTQTDTLSYLLTGRALSGVRGSESAILTQAITGLGVSGGESLAQQLGGQLGLDDVGLNTKGGDYKQSELSLGKRLGPKLYVKYIVGLFDSLQKVAVTYQINKKLQLEATSGVQQSVDLIYKIDTNRGPFGN